LYYQYLQINTAVQRWRKWTGAWRQSKAPWRTNDVERKRVLYETEVDIARWRQCTWQWKVRQL